MLEVDAFLLKCESIGIKKQAVKILVKVSRIYIACFFLGAFILKRFLRVL